MKRIYHNIITIIISVVCVIYFYQNRSQLYILKEFHIMEISVLFIIMFIYFFTLGYTFKLVLNLVGIKLNALETIGLSILTNFANYLGPTSPGSAVKAVYLKSVKGLDFAKFASVFVANNFFLFFMTGMVGIILYFLILLQFENIPVFIFWYCLVSTVVSVIPYFFQVPMIAGEGRVVKMFRSAAKGFNEMKPQKRGMILICLSFLLQFIVRMFIFKYTFEFMGKPIPIFISFALSVYTSMFDFNITPNNLGFQEVTGAYVLSLTGFDFTTGMIGLGVIRGAHLAVLLILTPFFTHYLLKLKNLDVVELNK